MGKIPKDCGNYTIIWHRIRRCKKLVELPRAPIKADAIRPASVSICSAPNLGDRLSALRIYGIARTRAFRALWMANELGLEYEHLPIEIGAAGARSPEFLAINPNGRLPFIVDDGFVLFESLAITLYLAKKHSNGRLYPGTLEGEAGAWQWSLWAVTEVDRGGNIWSLHAIRLPAAERDAIKRNEALRVLAAPFEGLDGAVAGQKYLLSRRCRVPASQAAGGNST